MQALLSVSPIRAHIGQNGMNTDPYLRKLEAVNIHGRLRGPFQSIKTMAWELHWKALPQRLCYPENFEVMSSSRSHQQ